MMVLSDVRGGVAERALKPLGSAVGAMAGAGEGASPDAPGLGLAPSPDLSPEPGERDWVELDPSGWPHPRSPHGLPDRASAQTKFTPAAQVRFLDCLAAKGHVRAACAAIGVSAQGAYLHRRRSPQFARAWDAALVLARPHAEAELAVRALDGVREDVWFRGEHVGFRVRHDSRLLLAHLARLDKACADGAAAVADAERFDDLLLALARGQVLGKAPERGGPAHRARDEDRLGAMLALPERAAFIHERGAAALAAALDEEERARLADDEVELHVAECDCGECEALDGNEDAQDAIVRGARAAAALEWDARRAASYAEVDAVIGGEGEGEAEAEALPPIEYKSLVPPAIKKKIARAEAQRRGDAAPMAKPLGPVQRRGMAKRLIDQESLRRSRHLCAFAPRPMGEFILSACKAVEGREPFTSLS